MVLAIMSQVRNWGTEKLPTGFSEGLKQHDFIDCAALTSNVVWPSVISSK